MALQYIDTINRQGFEAFWDFFVNPRQTAQYYWHKYNDFHEQDECDTDYLSPIFHYLFGLISRILLLPFTSTCYVLSRLFLVVLNPFYWQRNPAKSMLMGSVFLAFGGIALNNHYQWLLSFSQLFHPDQMKIAYETFLFPEGGLWVASPEIAGGYMVGTLVMMMVATLLYVGKMLAQGYNTVRLNNPLLKPGEKRDLVSITAPKYAPLLVLKHKTRFVSPQIAPDIAKSNNRHLWGVQPTLNFVSVDEKNRQMLFEYYKLKQPVIFERGPESQNMKSILDKALQTSKKP